ncbi:ribosomal protein S5 domain 2-like protein, partial [Suillus hirtellus]
LEICLKDLQKDHIGVLLKVSVINGYYHVTVKAESTITTLFKLQNKHSHLYTKAMPLNEELTKEIEADTANSRNDVINARKIWCFSTDTTGPNLLIDVTNGVQYLNKIKDFAFRWATKEGVCAEENMCGIHFNVLDVTLYTDAIHHGGGQIIPTCHPVCYTACLLATPGLQEPVYLGTSHCRDSCLSLCDMALFTREYIAQTCSTTLCDIYSYPYMRCSFPM